MTDLLVSIIIAICPPSTDGYTNDCMERVSNCAVELGTLITPKSIEKCIQEKDEPIIDRAPTNKVKYQKGLMRFPEDEILLEKIANGETDY